MIIARIFGGLGNQMFQYASMKAIAQETDQQVKFDLSWFQQSDDERESANHPYHLDKFETDVPVATDAEIKRTVALNAIPVPLILARKAAAAALRAGPPVVEPAHKVLYRTLGYCKEIIRDEEDEIDWPYVRRYCEEILSLTDETYFEGYWQSYRYFEGIREQLLSEFRLSAVIDSETVLSRIEAAENTVGIHVRRGDFVEKGYDLPQEYYESAISAMESAVESPEYFVFSDDTAWVKENLDLNRDVTHARENPGHVDLRLLARCDHQITANSTFSWWASWLNNNGDKRVVTPYTEEFPQYEDYIPSSWIGVEY